MSSATPYIDGRNGVNPSPLRRQHIAQPPHLLTTSLDNARLTSLSGIGAVQQTPLSATTSLSSPFALHASQSAYVQTPSNAARGISPMTFRSAPAVVAPAAYNPQQWAPMNGSSPQNARVLALAPRPVGPDEPVASPPPPYSPRRQDGVQESPRNLTETISPSDTTSPDTDVSQHTTPLTSANALSPDYLSRQHTNRLPDRSSTRTSPNVSTPLAFPPPPGAQHSNSRIRSTSKSHADRIFSSLTSRGRNTTTSPNSVEALHINTSYVLAPTPSISAASPVARAPGARRAASTGAIGLMGEPIQHSTHSPVTMWDPQRNVAVPPPPPGPPPASARTQSLNRTVGSPHVQSAPQVPVGVRRPPGSGTTLDAVPPTPADWREDLMSSQISTHERPSGPAPLHIDTGSILRRRPPGHDDVMTMTTATPSNARWESSASGLFRSPAVRSRSAKSLRERRSQSKNGKGPAVEDSATDVDSGTVEWNEEASDVRPTDLNLSNAQGGDLTRRPTSRQTPRSGAGLRSLDSTLSGAGQKVLSANAVTFGAQSTTSESTMYYSPDQDASSSLQNSPGQDQVVETNMDPNLSPSLRKLSSPIGQADHASKAKLSLVVPSSPGRRPVSHILHTPNEENLRQIPLTPSSTKRQRPTSDLLGPESPEAFAVRAIERHRLFAEQEAKAANDAERLKLFMNYVVAESKLRRTQFGAAYQDLEKADIEVFRNVLFQRTDPDNGGQEAKRGLANRAASERESILSSDGPESAAQSVSIHSLQHGSSSSATTDPSVSLERPDGGWTKDYVPCLSPIASMSIVTGQDEMDSRGRAPSRWWEDASQAGSAVNDGFNVLGRSKRESKYMGVPREARDSPALFEQRLSGVASSSNWQVPDSTYPHVDAFNEYPPEKVGWREDGITTRVPGLAQPPTPASAPPFTPDARGLDISRLVTLPPPYPRHHPAVNNNHPDLAGIRAVLRSMNDKDKPASIQMSFDTEMQEKRKRADSWCKHQRSLHDQDIRYRIDHEDINQDQFDDLERQLENKIEQSERDIVQAEFDAFQGRVVTPMHALFAERIAEATTSLQNLSGSLFSDAQNQNPNLPQEEGDELPELLEKLTQLKWLFEARELLHRQTYDLLSERNEKYRAIVLLPYKQSHNQVKYDDAEKFFATDARTRKIVFDKVCLERATAFLHVIDSNVSRGVEMQLDAFWQIAPLLNEVLHKVPVQHLNNFEIRIPVDEYAENPSYHDHPMQYLYSLLNHAEKSTHQFIESQINLFCLLHEIRSYALTARCRVQTNENPQSDMTAYQQREEKRLTADLKEKVDVVEGQWEEGLGEEMLAVRERVREKLLEDGGWDDDEDSVA